MSKNENTAGFRKGEIAAIGGIASVVTPEGQLGSVVENEMSILLSHLKGTKVDVIQDGKITTVTVNEKVKITQNLVMPLEIETADWVLTGRCEFRFKNSDGGHAYFTSDNIRVLLDNIKSVIKGSKKVIFTETKLQKVA
jgi:hypothetical protein